MHAEFAIIQVHTIHGLRMDFENCSQAIRHKNSIRVSFSCPVMHIEGMLLNYLRPNSNENIQVQSCSEFTTFSALQAAIYNGSIKSWADFNRHVAVDSVCLATKNTHFARVL